MARPPASPPATDDVDDLLNAAAAAVRSNPAPSLLPKQTFTRPDEHVSHYCSEADLVRLRSCSKGSMHPYAELAAGATLGNFGATGVVIHKFFNLPAGGRLDSSDVFVLFLMALFAVLAAVFLRISIRSSESVDSICDEITKRPRSTPL